MNLWIRSQDKRILTPITSYIIEINNSLYHLGMPLADYKTKERALEVLDEIQKLLIDCSSLKISRLNLNNGYDDLKIPYEINTKIYEMPKE